MNIRPLATGILSFVPGVMRLRPAYSTQGTDSAAYGLQVWRGHLNALTQAGMEKVPPIVAELGPGFALGVGIAALLHGADRYLALDVKRHAVGPSALRIFDDMVVMLSSDAGTNPLAQRALRASLAADRVARLRDEIAQVERRPEGSVIQYVAPWTGENRLGEASIDLVVSQAVFEHVTDLDGAYGVLERAVKTGGWMSHRIDFGCHGLAEVWNGHRAYSEVMWTLVQGRRGWTINREPLSTHLRLIEKHGFRVAGLHKDLRPDGLKREQMAERWQRFPDEDLACSGVSIQAQRV